MLTPPVSVYETVRRLMRNWGYDPYNTAIDWDQPFVKWKKIFNQQGEQLADTDKTSG